mgnify:FL=1
MAKSPNWTQEELSILREHYPKLGKSIELQSLFSNRTLEGIALKANRIGLRVEHNIRKGRTQEEYTDLLKNTNFECLEPYKGSTEPILHRCKICSHTWNTRPQHALKEGAQCPVCDLRTRTNNIEYVDDILDKANMLRHSDYLGSLKPLVLEHLTCGYMWTTAFSYIQQGSGCPLCNNGFGYSMSKENLPEKATLYLLKVIAGGEIFLKVGVTVRPINKRIIELKSRFKEVYPTIEVLKEYVSTGINVLKKEQEILNKYTRYISSLDFEGKTELLHIGDLDQII